MKKIKAILILSLAAAILFIVGCASSTAQSVKVGEDEIPSLYSIIGEKKITGTETSTENDRKSTTVTYESGSITEREAVDYMLELIASHGFSIQQDAIEQGNGKYYQLTKNSETDGKHIVVSLYIEEEGSTVIKYMVGGVDIL